MEKNISTLNDVRNHLTQWNNLYSLNQYKHLTTFYWVWLFREFQLQFYLCPIKWIAIYNLVMGKIDKG